MSKGIELIHNASWQNDSAVSSIIELCPTSSLAVRANSNQVSSFNYFKEGDEDATSITLTLPAGDTITSVSFHPSGQHILIATQDRLLLANVLVDGIVPFWEAYHLSVSECKFSVRGTLFAAICSTSIVVYDFINGSEIVRIKSCATSLKSLSFGQNCSIFALSTTAEEGMSTLCKYDALTGETSASYKSEDDILAYALANDTKPIILSSNNSVIYLNKELNQSKIVSIENEYSLSGAICVSSEGLVFVGLQCKDSRSSIVRIYSAVGGDYYDEPIKETLINTMHISFDDKHLVINNSSYQIKDNRISSAYITSLDTVSSAVEEDETDNQEVIQLLVSNSYVETKKEKIKICSLESLRGK